MSRSFAFAFPPTSLNQHKAFSGGAQDHLGVCVPLPPSPAELQEDSVLVQLPERDSEV